MGVACGEESDDCSCEGGLEGRHVSRKRDVVGTG